MDLYSADPIMIKLQNVSLGSNQARQRDTKVDENDDLVLNIKKFGLQNPITVMLLPDDGSGEKKYEIISGQRRFRAHEILQKQEIKAIVIQEKLSEFDAKKISLAENAARKQMKDQDYTDTIELFMERYGSTKVVAEELGLSVETVRRYIRASRLPKNVRQMVRDKKFSMDTALKALKSLGDDEAEVDENLLVETAIAMNSLSKPAKEKFIDIKTQRPGMSTEEAKEKALKRATQNTLTIEVTDDKISMVEQFRQHKQLESKDEAASEIFDIGLNHIDE